MIKVVRHFRRGTRSFHFKPYIYQIAKNYILGFADDTAIEKHNLRLLDSLEYAKSETLQEKLNELFD